ncbi:MAG: hypothetical protein EOO56_16070 [Hymenobacter sp.]|nr:MAG: hypothetical protein EOO56_16070 [Hymenobacter sp.]
MAASYASCEGRHGPRSLTPPVLRARQSSFATVRSQPACHADLPSFSYIKRCCLGGILQYSSKVGQLRWAISFNVRNPKRTRRRYTVEFKAEVALAALTERQPPAELAAHYQLAPAQLSRWKLHLHQ